MMTDFLLNNMLNARAEFGKTKHEYINAIQEFCGDAIEGIDISFRGNKMYINFESWCSLDDKFLSKFCNEFGLFEFPTVEIHQYTNNGWIISYNWEFIKILEGRVIND